MKVLVVEDDRTVGQYLRRGLEEAQYHADVVTDGYDALRIASGGQYDVVVLDLRLPGMSGLEVLRTVRDRGIATPILILTAQDEVGQKVEALRAGADDYVTKPFSLEEVLARVELSHQDVAPGAGLKRYVKMFYDEHVNAYQVEIWETLEPPPTSSHSFKVLNQMGLHKPITAIPVFRPALNDIRGLNGVSVSFRETDLDRPLNYRISNPGWDDDYARSHQEPNRPQPNSPQNTVIDANYFVSFQRGWVKDANQVPPVLYQNAMMEPSSADFFSGPAPTPGVMDGSKNVMGMRWIVQRELGGTIVYFHQVELPPGAVEGTHQHTGSEELYYFIEGEGIAYLGDGDDPSVDAVYPLVNPAPEIYGLGPKPCRAVPVRPGITLFTKSGGIHGVRNPPGNKGPLKFVAFGYHSS